MTEETEDINISNQIPENAIQSATVEASEEETLAKSVLSLKSSIKKSNMKTVEGKTSGKSHDISQNVEKNNAAINKAESSYSTIHYTGRGLIHPHTVRHVTPNYIHTAYMNPYTPMPNILAGMHSPYGTPTHMYQHPMSGVNIPIRTTRIPESTARTTSLCND
ncbi:unnamed protein product [Mytilus coruscus]|uniref:Uncharacterized protein n=1 Tax=Mytilus coruscus TaxID=42192 RepID=A0A6J8EW00_MYTCO|nr:unnamed protein product [Mytilus coruscus]